MDLCKVRYDGFHYLLQPYTNITDIKTETIIEKTMSELGFDEKLDKKKLFENEWATQNFPYAHKGRKPIDEYNIKLEEELKNLYKFFIKDYKENEIKQLIIDSVMSEIDILDYYEIVDDIPCLWLENYIEKFLERQKENLKGRKSLFRRKAISNDWNYFVTFTYDDKKHDEESFVKSLKKKLQNLHTNYGWLYMGCFERSQTERLHFHGLIYVPDNMMKSALREENYYNTTEHKMAKIFINEEFENKIGRNDFKAITKFNIDFTNALDYILKYIRKSDNRLVYSRGIKDDYYCLINFNESIITKLKETSPYYVANFAPITCLDKALHVDTTYN